MKPYPCPSCEAVAVNAVQVRDDSIQEATYCCPDGHLFTIRWLRQPLSAAVLRVSSGRIGSTKEDSPRAALVTPQTEGLATNDLRGVV